MELSSNSAVNKIIQYANEKGFSSFEKIRAIHFHPEEMDWNIYLAIYIDIKDEEISFRIKEHKFLTSKHFLDRKVSEKWLMGFFNFRSNDAQKEREEYIQRKDLNKNIILENESLGLDETPEENNMANTPLASGRLDFTLSDESDGPHSQDWDSRDWQDYMSGPDFEDGEPQW